MDSCGVLGDISLDVVSYVNATLADEEALQHIRSPVELLPGGSGVQLARAAVWAGVPRVHLFGKVGSPPSDGQYDLAATVVLDTLHREGISTTLAASRSWTTGRVMVVYMSGRQRVMVADPGANLSFSVSDLTEPFATAIASIECLVVSGYSLIGESRLAAARHMFGVASAAGVPIVLDLVPHRLDDIFTLQSFLLATAGVSMVVSETGTLARLVGTVDEEELVGVLLSHFPAVLLRREGGVQVYADIDRRRVVEDTKLGAAASSNRRGHYDRETMKVLRREHRRLVSFVHGRSRRGPPGEAGMT